MEIMECVFFYLKEEQIKMIVYVLYLYLHTYL